MAPPSPDIPRRSVLMIGSEAVPFSKTGGLADVLGALPAALGRLGWDVTVALPRYRGVTAGTLVERVPVSVGAGRSAVHWRSSWSAREVSGGAGSSVDRRLPPSGCAPERVQPVSTTTSSMIHSTLFSLAPK